MASFRITLKKSTIGYNKIQRRVIDALGLKRLSHSVEQQDTPTIRGMIEKVKHLVAVETLDS